MKVEFLPNLRQFTSNLQAKQLKEICNDLEQTAIQLARQAIKENTAIIDGEVHLYVGNQFYKANVKCTQKAELIVQTITQTNGEEYYNSLTQQKNSKNSILRKA